MWGGKLFLTLLVCALVRADELPGTWTVHEGNVSLFQSFGGVFLLVDSGDPAHLRILAGPDSRDVPLAPEQLQDFNYVALDGEGGLWIFPDPLVGSTTWFRPSDTLGWIPFEGPLNSGTAYRDKEAAFTFARSHYDHPFALGAPGEMYQLVHGPDGRMAYVNDRGRICWYDGQRWRSPRTGKELPDGDTVTAPPRFNEQGGLFADGERGVYELSYTKGARTWTLVRETGDPVPSPRPFKAEILSYPQWSGRMDGVAWSLSGFELLVSMPGDKRLMILPAGHPLTRLKGTVDVAMDVTGQWAFSGKGSQGRLVILYQPDPPFDWWPPIGRVLTLNSDRTSLLAQLGLDSGQAPDTLVRMRTSGGDWFELTGTPVLDPGSHPVEFEISCTRPPFFAGPLPSTLSYGLDLDRKIRDWIGQLGAESFAERDEAEARLQDAFLIARPHLEDTVRSTGDPEVAFRILRLLTQGTKGRP